MTRPIQKQFEIYYADSLAKAMGYNWIISTPPNETDWPDLLIQTPADNFGLEVRDIFVDEHSNGSFEKRSESFRQKLLNQLSAKYYEKKNSPILLEVSGPFDNKIAESILSYLLSIDFQEWKKIEHDIILNGTKTRLYVDGLPSSFANYNRWRYIDDNIGWVQRISDIDVEIITKDKSLNIIKYKKNNNKVSLLIVANRIKNSGKLLLEKNSQINTHGFDKVFFYMHPLDAIVYGSD
ncbi:MAG: hypothetical protein E3K37_11625 [Candidatus Kuenenia sp.]|nr:hypothetical protein [Candidatus Kuenenia hertensis]